METVLKILSWVGKLTGLVGALNAIPGVDPGTGVLIFFLASLVKDTVNRIGDYLDDKTINNSFGN